MLNSCGPTQTFFSKFRNIFCIFPLLLVPFKLLLEDLYIYLLALLKVGIETFWSSIPFGSDVEKIGVEDRRQKGRQGIDEG